MSTKKDKWAAWSAAVAVISLIAALVFNGIQVRDSANAQRQARVATELGLLAEIQTAMTRSIYAKVPHADELRDLEADRRSSLSRRAYQLVAEEAYGMNYFAWLFNNGYLKAPEADELLGPVMVCEFQQLFVRVFEDPAGEVPELTKFVQRRVEQVDCTS